MELGRRDGTEGRGARHSDRRPTGGAGHSDRRIVEFLGELVPSFGPGLWCCRCCRRSNLGRLDRPKSWQARVSGPRVPRRSSLARSVPLGAPPASCFVSGRAGPPSPRATEAESRPTLPAERTRPSGQLARDTPTRPTAPCTRRRGAEETRPPPVRPKAGSRDKRRGADQASARAPTRGSRDPRRGAEARPRRRRWGRSDQRGAGPDHPKASDPVDSGPRPSVRTPIPAARRCRPFPQGRMPSDGLANAQPARRCLLLPAPKSMGVGCLRMVWAPVCRSECPAPRSERPHRRRRLFGVGPLTGTGF
jgi:hypothetical protein